MGGRLCSKLMVDPCGKFGGPVVVEFVVVFFNGQIFT